MREIDPFAFFYNHASAIRGLGGEGRSPDPRYCFHTPYVEVRPGVALFELSLIGVHSSHGELALRVHAFRPESGENASLAAAGRLNVWVEDKQDLSIKVRFGALRDVKYAFYGHFLEDGDIHADGVTVTLLEPEGQEHVFVEPPRSDLAAHEEKREVRPANALIHPGAPQLSVPVSQDCSWAQLEEAGLTAQGSEVIALWSEAFCMAAMQAYGIRGTGLEGQVVGPVSLAFWQDITSSDLAVRRLDEDIRAAEAVMFADFLLWPTGPGPQPDPALRWQTIRAWVERLKIGGLAVIHLRYRHEEGPLHAASAVDGDDLSRNEIGKWALRLIGEGFSVAPMAFLPSTELIFDEDGLAAFNLIVRRG